MTGIDGNGDYYEDYDDDCDYKYHDDDEDYDDDDDDDDDEEEEDYDDEDYAKETFMCHSILFTVPTKQHSPKWSKTFLR